MDCLVHCMLVQMGSQERKVEQGSKKGREGVVPRMGMSRAVGLHGVVGGHFGQVLIQGHEDWLGKTHQAPLEQAGMGMAGPLDQDGQH